MKIKKIMSLVLAMSMAAALFTGCGTDKENQAENTKDAKVVASADDMPGAKIGVQLGTTGDIYASDYEAEGSTIERYNKGADAIQALKQGKIDAVIIDNEPAKVFVEKNEGLQILDEEFVEEQYAIALKKGNTELLEKINGAIKELKEDGTLDSIIAKYIKE